MNVNWILGASSGIGAALGLRLAGDGELVVASGRRSERLQELARRHPNLRPLPLDATEREAVARAVRIMVEEYGPLRRVFLNLGDYEPAPLVPFDPELFERIMTTNYLGVVNGLAAVLPAMLAQGEGEIYITASVAGYRGLPNAASYGASKAALIHLAECARLELAPRGICVRVINPGFVKTPLTDKNRFAMPGLLSAEQAADRIVRALPGKGFEIAFPKRLVWPLKCLRILPYVLYFRLIGRRTGVV